MSRRARIVTVLLLVLLAWGCYALRRQVIGRFFADGAPGDAPALVADDGMTMAPAARVRVVLQDGLSRDHAMGLESLSNVCARGLDFVVDVGFPTVSLPVQHVLWTGLTQQQSGVEYRIGRLDPVPAAALPGRVSGSVAIGESHRDIVHSFGFSSVLPSLDDEAIEDEASTWRASGFLEAATAAVASASPLVFVHVLRVDETGHAEGGASAAYAQAARESDAMLAALVAADPAPGRTRWFVLADHGHRPGGGHGDAEPEIRLVRACIFGDVEPTPPSDTAVHLIDLHRAIADAVGVKPIEGARGRTLAHAFAHPEPGATLPRARTFDLAIGAILAIAALLGTLGVIGRETWLAALWPLVSWAGVVLVHGAITLSNPVVYPPLGLDVLIASVGGFAIFGVALFRLAGRMPPWRAALGSLLPLAGVWLATACVVGVPHALVGGGPPLLPGTSALCSVLATVLAGALAIAALVVSIRRDQSSAAA